MSPRARRRPAWTARNPLEKSVQVRVIAVYEAVGCDVAVTSPGRKGGTWQTPGIPDLYVFPPVGRGLPFWHETKRPTGRQSAAQVKWQALCEARGVGCVVGGVEQALAYLRRLGLVV